SLAPLSSTYHQAFPWWGRRRGGARRSKPPALAHAIDARSSRLRAAARVTRLPSTGWNAAPVFFVAMASCAVWVVLCHVVIDHNAPTQRCRTEHGHTHQEER